MLSSVSSHMNNLLKDVTDRRSKTILFAPLESVGHVNSLERIADHLKQNGYRTVFLFMEPILTKLKAKGHEVYDALTPELVETKDTYISKDKWNEVINEVKHTFSLTPIELLERQVTQGMGMMRFGIMKHNENMEKLVKLIKPDLIVIDHYYGIPALFTIDVPWIRVYSANPLCLYDTPDLPHCWLGESVKDWDINNPKINKFAARAREASEKMVNSYNEYWTSFKLPELPCKQMNLIPTSPYLNLYMYPDELDYKEEGAQGWERCESLIRNEEVGSFKIPEKLLNKPGKLIYLSMGSLTSVDIDLMKRLTSYLADSPHRFIVSKGANHDQYELPDNMWGEKFLPQLEVLKSIDLLMFHGGNNTLTEAFYYGVPGFIVLPVFGDQLDNAIRIQEKGFGVRVLPYKCSKEELLEAIEKVVSNEDTKKRMKAISERMQKPESRDKALRLVRGVVEKLLNE